MEVNNHIAINPDEKPSLLLVLTCWWSLGILQSHCDHQPDHQCQFLTHHVDLQLPSVTSGRLITTSCKYGHEKGLLAL